MMLACASYPERNQVAIFVHPIWMWFRQDCELWGGRVPVYEL